MYTRIFTEEYRCGDSERKLEKLENYKGLLNATIETVTIIGRFWKSIQKRVIKNIEYTVTVDETGEKLKLNKGVIHENTVDEAIEIIKKEYENININIDDIVLDKEHYDSYSFYINTKEEIEVLNVNNDTLLDFIVRNQGSVIDYFKTINGEVVSDILI